MPVTWNTKWKWDTEYSADSVEWCPVEPYRNVLVCGTYQLDKKDEEDPKSKQKRLGRIYLFVIDEKTTELSPIQTVDTAGVLDQKWCYHLMQDSPVLAVVTSEGVLDLYKLVIEEESLKLKLWCSYSFGQDCLALSLDWSTNKSSSDEVFIVVSDSLGHVTVIKLTDNCLQKVDAWKAHDFEAWIAAFNYWNPYIFYSGGDDCLFKCYDVRMPDVMSINRIHEAGVTSIRSHVDVEHHLLTGSYDEKVRLWDARNLRRCVAESDVKGGVWRLKWHPYKTNTVLAACMYGGFRMLKCDEKVEVICEYLEHDSIAYGADWKHDELSLVATCSFYDCKMHISDISI